MFKNEKYMIKEWEIIKKLIVCLQQHLNSKIVELNDKRGILR